MPGASVAELCKAARAPPALNGSPRVLQDLVEGRIPFLLALPRYPVPPEERRVAVGLRVLEVGTGRARRQPHREDIDIPVSMGSARSDNETIRGVKLPTCFCFRSGQPL